MTPREQAAPFRWYEAIALLAVFTFFLVIGGVMS